MPVGTSGRSAYRLSSRIAMTLDSAALDEGHHGREACHSHRDLPAEQVRNRRPAAAISDVQHVDSGDFVQHFADEMMRGSVARCAEGDLARIALGVIDQFPDRLDGQCRMHGNRENVLCDRAQRREVLHPVVRHLLLQRDRQYMGRRVADTDGVTVRCGAGEKLRADRAARARLVLDDERLAHALAHLLSDRARHDVYRSAGRKRRDHAYRLAGVALAVGGEGCREQSRCCDQFA